MSNAALWAEELDAAVEAEGEFTDLDPKEWPASGRASKANPNKEDWDWWIDNGPKMLDRYQEWREGDEFNPRWEIWTTPDGKEAIELGLMVPWGSTQLKCFIDRVFIHPFDRELAVVDLKSGSRTPASDRQLGRYASAIEAEYGVRPLYGGYYMARTGSCALYRIDRPSLRYGSLVAESEKIEQAFEQGLFVANPSQLCGSCDVRQHCKER